MSFYLKNIAFNLKRIRNVKKMSLEDLADQTGVSKSMLGQIEREESNPTIEVLGKIVSGLRIDFTDLIEEPSDSVYEVEFRNLVPTKDVSGQYKVYTYFSFAQKRKFEIYMIEIEPGGIYECGGHGEKTEEYINVVEGVLTLNIDGAIYELGTKDALRFESDRNHKYINKGKVKTVLMVYFMFKPKM